MEGWRLPNLIKMEELSQQRLCGEGELHHCTVGGWHFRHNFLLFPFSLLVSLGSINSNVMEGKGESLQGEEEERREETLFGRYCRETWHHTEAQLAQKLPAGLRGWFCDAELPSWLQVMLTEVTVPPWPHLPQALSFTLFRPDWKITWHKSWFWILLTPQNSSYSPTLG